MISEGKKAPAFSLEGSDGATHGPATFKGALTVLFFYPRDNTPGCTKEACGFRDGYRALTKAGVQVFGVSRDSLASHKTFIEDHRLPFVLLSDPDLKVLKAYGAWGEKMRYGKITEGTLRSTVIIGRDGNILKHWPLVRKADAHPAQVIDWLKEHGHL